MDAPWRIRLLGALHAELGDETVTRFRTQMTAALLARLAFFPRRIHSREELVDLIWPEADLDSGRNSLRVAISSLRRQLEPPSVPTGSVLVTDRNFVSLNPAAFRSDVAEFEKALAQAARAASPAAERDALQRAADVYHGELLPGFYQDWVLDERERLSDLFEGLQARLQKLSSLPVSAVIAAEETPSTDLSVPPLPRLGVPMQFTRFFGREQECSELAGLLQSPQTRLVTLTGPGGSGKTRLAIQIAQAAAEFVCFVPLADLTDADALPSAISSALRLPHSPLTPPLEQVVTALTAQRSPLLVLDNLEHLVERGAPVVLSLLTRVPDLTCLVTSRRRLTLPAEREYPVLPLALPELSETPEQVARAASAQLFVDRAQAARPDFQLTRGNAAAVAALCRKLEGIPLALELVAARSVALTPGQMVERLGQDFGLLSTAHRAGEKRHRSLWAAISWSYDLIPPSLQRFFAGLSVFRGGCTIEAAQAVCGEKQALEALTQLRERSLAIVEDGASGLRFRLLETLREFADEQLSPQERRALARRHAGYFEVLSAEARALWSGPDQNRGFGVLDAEIDNLRAALAFCRDDPSDAEWDGGETGLRLAVSLGEYWATRGLLREGLIWLEGALGRGGSVQIRARALAEAGWLAAGMGDHDQAEAALTEAIALSREADDRTVVASALRRRGTVALWRGDNPQAAVDLKEALALSRETGDDSAIAYALNGLGVLAGQWQEDQALSRSLYEEALALFRKCGDRQRMAYCLHNIGNIALDSGDPQTAETLLRESLALAEDLGDHWHRAYCLRSLGDVAEARGDLSAASALLEEGRDLCRRLGDRMTEAGTVCSLGVVARGQGDLAGSQEQYKAALALYQGLDHAVGAAICRVSLAELALEHRQWEHAIRLISDAAECQEALSFGTLRARCAAVRQSVETAQGPGALKTD